MLEGSALALNRMIAPQAPLVDLLELTAAVGLSKVELCNDIPGVRLLDSLEPQRVRDLLGERPVSVLGLNVLLRFDLPERLKDLQAELRELAAVAARIACPAILLCPNNDPADRRTADQALRDTIGALQALEPILSGAGLLGYVEPLGFPQSSLRSLHTAQRAIRESGCRRYRLVYDTFHHFLGPDDSSLVEGCTVDLTGLVHVSGLEESLRPEAYRDGHRVLPGERDLPRSREQIERLLRAGYRGDVSFEPFSPAVQSLGPAALRDALRGSISCLTGPG